MSFFWKPYVPVAARRAKAKKQMEKLRQKGQEIQPIELEGRTIARSFWGKGWCDHLESFSDFENRLPRGRTYVRNGSVCHLEIKAGRIEAIVCGSEMYKITITVKPLAPATWKAVKDKCRGQIGSMLELLEGRLSNHVMAVVSDRKEGLFPQEGEIKLDCSCPDWATMCKHVAAVLYGVGHRLDSRPELLFILRGVDAAELIAAEVALPATGEMAEDALGEENLAELFGIDLESAPAPGTEPPRPSRKKTKVLSKPPVPMAKTAKPAPMPSPSPVAKKTIRLAVKTAPVKPQRAPRPVFNPAAPTGAAIARLRKQAGLSVDQFASALGVMATSIQRWEATRGPLRLQPRTLAALTQFQLNYQRPK